MTVRSALKAARPLVAPGVYDALSASIATEAGFSALYVSGAGVAYTRLGRPDIGLVSMTEMADTIRLIGDRVATPLIVDADNGHGNALNTQRTVRLYENAGAGALQLEDQTMPKRCGHLRDKKLISAAEMVGKVKAAVDARKSEDTLIIARTDAIAVEGFDAALDRASLYVEAGADILFVEAPRDLDQMRAIVSRFGNQVPLLANMVEGGDTPISSSQALGELGFSVVIFPGGIVRAIAHTAVEYYAQLKAAGNNDAFRDRMYDFNGLNRVIGTPELLDLGAKYDG